MSKNLASSSVPPESRVRDIAYSLWIEEGMPDGRAESHWLKALDMVNADAVEAAPEEAAKPKRKAPAVAAAKKAAPRKRS